MHEFVANAPHSFWSPCWSLPADVWLPTPHERHGRSKIWLSSHTLTNAKSQITPTRSRCNHPHADRRAASSAAYITCIEIFMQKQRLRTTNNYHLFGLFRSLGWIKSVTNPSQEESIDSLIIGVTTNKSGLLTSWSFPQGFLEHRWDGSWSKEKFTMMWKLVLWPIFF